MGILKKAINTINEIFEEEVDTDLISAYAFNRQILDGTFYKKYVFGVTEKRRGPELSNPLQASGAIFIGKMGSGKSESSAFTIYTMQMASGDCTYFILLDPEKQLGNYDLIFENDNCARGLGRVIKGSDTPDVKDISTVIAGISCAYDEFLARSRVMGQVGFDNIGEYEKYINNNNKKTILKRLMDNNKSMTDEEAEEWYEEAVPDDKRPIKMAMMVMLIEEFHALVTHPNFDYQENYREQGSPANKLYKLSKVGRSYGISMFAISQRVAKDIPSDLLAGLNNKLCFLPPSSYDASALGLDHATQIRSGEPGKYACEDGFGQYPFMEKDTAKRALEVHKKEYEGIHYGPKPSEIRDKLGNNSSVAEAIKKLTFGEVVANMVMYPLEDIASKFLNRAGFDINRTPDDYPYELIVEKGDEKFGVKCVKEVKRGYGPSQGLSKEKKEFISKHAEVKGMNGVLFFSASASKNMGGSSDEIGKDAMKNMADILDNKNKYSDEEFKEMLSPYSIFRDEEGSEKPKKENKSSKKGKYEDLDKLIFD
jgi:hypothetical protein